MALPFDVLLDDILFADTTFSSPSTSPPAIVPTTNTISNNNTSFDNYCQQVALPPQPSQQSWISESPLEYPSPSSAPIMIPGYPKANVIMEQHPMKHYVEDNTCVLSPVLSSSEGSCSSSCYGKFVCAM